MSADPELLRWRSPSLAVEHSKIERSPEVYDAIRFGQYFGHFFGPKKSKSDAGYDRSRLAHCSSKRESPERRLLIHVIIIRLSDESLQLCVCGLELLGRDNQW